MDKIERIKNDSIREFGSKATRERYIRIAGQGLWESELVLIEKYFKAGSRILDIGCGSGRTAIPLRERGFEVVGVDITPAMIATARRVTEEKKLAIDYRVGDATSLEFSDNSFDGAIFANNGWAQIPGAKNRRLALSELYRVLKPGGFLILTAHWRYYSGQVGFYWAGEWIRYFILKPLGIKTAGVEFGDMFFRRDQAGAQPGQRQFIHLSGRGEVAKQIKTAGFKMVEQRAMAKLSSSDAAAGRASLKKNFNSYKSPVFYVCEK